MHLVASVCLSVCLFALALVLKDEHYQPQDFVCNQGAYAYNFTTAIDQFLIQLDT